MIHNRVRPNSGSAITEGGGFVASTGSLFDIEAKNNN